MHYRNLENILNEKKKIKTSIQGSALLMFWCVFLQFFFSDHIWHFLKSQVARSIVSLITSFQGGREGRVHYIKYSYRL